MKQRSGLGTAREKRVNISDDLLWGVHPVCEGLEANPKQFSEIILQKNRQGGKVEQIIAMARQGGVKITFVDALRLTGEGSATIRHQGILARVSPAPLMDFTEFNEKMRDQIQAGKQPCLMICDSLQDPHNLGAIIRSSLAAGAAGIILTRERSAPLGGTAAKSSAGAVSHIDICQAGNLVNALKTLKETGFWVFGAVSDHRAQSVYDTDLNVPACLVIGSEGKGIRPLVKKECDVLISIPMAGSLDSLNSSVAAGVLLFEALRQRGGIYISGN